MALGAHEAASSVGEKSERIIRFVVNNVIW